MRGNTGLTQVGFSLEMRRLGNRESSLEGPLYVPSSPCARRPAGGLRRAGGPGRAARGPARATPPGRGQPLRWLEECCTELLLLSLKTQLGRKLGTEQQFGAALVLVKQRAECAPQHTDARRQP